MATEDEQLGCCCGVPRMKTSRHRVHLIVGGVVNILMPFGVGAIIAGVLMPSRHLVRTGVIQMVCALFIFGAVWAFFYGILMVCYGLLGEVKSPSGTQSGPPLSATP